MSNRLNNFLPIIKNTASTVFIRGLFGTARIIVLLLITRQFGPSEFGRLSLVLSVTEIFKVMADFGLDTIAIRRFSMNRKLSQRILENALTLKLIGATIAYVSAVVFFWFSYSSTDGLVLLLVIALSIYTTLLVNAFVSFFQSSLRVSSVISSNVLSAVIYIVLTLACLLLHYPLIAFAVIIPLSEAINLLFTVRIYRGMHPLHLNFRRKIMFSLLKESFPVGVAGLIIVSYIRMDNLMIGWFLGEHGVGEYAAAYRFTEPFFLIFSSLSLSLYAHFSSFRNPFDFDKIKRSLISILIPLTVLSMIMAVGMFVFSRHLAGLLSDKYRTSLGILMILSWLIIFRAVNPQLTAFINSRGKYALVTIIASGNLIVNILLNLLLIPRYGVNGAAGAVVGTEIFNTFVQTATVAVILRTAHKEAPVMTQRSTVDLKLPSPFGAASLAEGYQKRYLPYFRNAPGVVLDIGCGHGDVLAFLKKDGIPSYGVDSSEAALRLCSEKGLDIRLNDALCHLKELAPASLGGIFCAHVIEHMDPANAVEFLRECRRVLKPGGRLILITPNCKDLRITERFWLDMTHVRPYPEKLLVPLLERENFTILEVTEDREPAKNIFERSAKIFLRLWFMGYMFRGDLVVISEIPGD